MDGRIDRGQATRTAILSAAIDLFVESGYEGTSIEAVLQRCDISRGALYHHFVNKEALFAAVLERVEEDVARRIAEAASGATDPLDALRRGCSTWLDLATEPAVRSIVLTDAPTVVGWEAWRAIDDRYALGLLKSVFGRAVALGRLRPEFVDTYAHVLLAALIEMSLMIVRDPANGKTASAARDAVETLIAGFLGVRPGSGWDADR